MAASVKLEGFEKAEAMLGRLPFELRGKAVTSGLRTAGRQVVKVARALVPISEDVMGDDTGGKHLRDALTVKVIDGRKGPIAIVGPMRPDGNHAHLVEGASDKTPEGMDVRHFSHGVWSGEILRKQPFLGPAAESSKGNAEQAVAEAIERAIKRVTG